MRSNRARVLAFSSGAALYPAVEILYRGRTHWSMALLGGICVLALREISAALPEWRIGRKALVGTLVVTELEFLTGAAVNLALGWNVWDYADRPGNVLGQVCPLYSFFWFLLSLPVLAGIEAIRKKRLLKGTG